MTSNIVWVAVAASFLVLCQASTKESPGSFLSLASLRLQNSDVAQDSAMCDLAAAITTPLTNSSWKCINNTPLTSPCGNSTYSPWYGVTCNSKTLEGKVISIGVGNTAGQGTIPNSIGNLQSLTYFGLYHIGLSGSIPSTIGLLSNLDGIFMIYNSFSGSIPSSIGLMSKLHGIYLYHNSLTGSIPSSIRLLTNLQNLQISYNSFTGSVPASLCTLPLDYIYIDHNPLTCYVNCLSTKGYLTSDTIPHCITTDSVMCDLAAAITTTATSSSWKCINNIPVTNPCGNSSYSPWYGVTCDYPPTDGKVISIYVGSTPGQGTIPSSIGHLQSLTALSLFHIGLSGSIPSSIGMLSNLDGIFMIYNSFSGSIPSSIGLMSKLHGIYLYHNSLTGYIPSSIRLLTNLQNLQISYNSLSGRAPDSLCDLPLEYIYIDHNPLSCYADCLSTKGYLTHDGVNQCVVNTDSVMCDLAAAITTTATSSSWKCINNIPVTNPCGNSSYSSWYGVTCDSQSAEGQVTTIHVAYSSGQGTIPRSIGNLQSLSFLGLYHISLTGTIPKTIGLLTNLQTVYFIFNSLTGSIPSTIGSLSKLRNMFFYYNSLTGIIPSSIGLLSSLHELQLSFNSLSGSVPASLCALPSNDMSIIINENPFLTCYADCLSSKGSIVFGTIPACISANVRYIELVQTKNYLQISELAVYDYHGTNIAVNKSTTASPAFRGDFCSYDSANAVDGIVRNKMFNNCSLHAYHSQSTYSTFWKLDLGSDNSVRSIVYYNRGDCCQERAIGATLNAYNSTNHLVATWSLNGDFIQTFNLTDSLKTVTATTSCPSGSFSYGGSCYFLTSSSGSFDTVQSQCVTAGGNLATITSSDMNNNITAEFNGVKMWIGYRRMSDGSCSSSNGWYWVKDGSNSSDSYTNWAINEPNCFKGLEEFCAQLLTDGAWNDKECHFKYKGLCEVAESSEFVCNVLQPSWIGDHYCDSTGGYNTAACNWDGGDCCSQTCDGTIYNQCNAPTFPKICLNPLYQDTVTTESPTKAPTKVPSKVLLPPSPNRKKPSRKPTRDPTGKHKRPNQKPSHHSKLHKPSSTRKPTRNPIGKQSK